MTIIKCQYCLINSGRTKKGLECCELRRIANGTRENFYALHDKEKERLRPLVNAEKLRLYEIRKNKLMDGEK